MRPTCNVGRPGRWDGPVALPFPPGPSRLVLLRLSSSDSPRADLLTNRPGCCNRSASATEGTVDPMATLRERPTGRISSSVWSPVRNRLTYDGQCAGVNSSTVARGETWNEVRTSPEPAPVDRSGLSPFPSRSWSRSLTLRYLSMGKRWPAGKLASYTPLLNMGKEGTLRVAWREAGLTAVEWSRRATVVVVGLVAPIDGHAFCGALLRPTFTSDDPASAAAPSAISAETAARPAASKPAAVLPPGICGFPASATSLVRLDN
mmetsp:Transcript_38210/g.114329  ORF Transcript_38210/g.114329 Transcript_38210/m.114329 type:complete len:262 (+) Transcript_38210:391-1176(+)